MKLYLLRHGEADWPDWDKPDDERPLTERGIKEMKKVAKFLEKLDLKLDQIVTSPLPRAKETAEIVADRLKLDLKQDRILAKGFDVPGLNRLLHKYPGASLMVVGHDPDFTEVIGTLTGAAMKLSKAGLALVDLDAVAMDGRLLWLFPPKLARKAG